MVTVEIRVGHCLDLLREMPDESVQCCVTSPPYWGLRDYGDPGKEWPAVSYRPLPGLPEVEVPAQVAALGLEPEPYHYVAHLVAVFREVRRVLREDGTLWLNLGDGYAGGGGYAPDAPMNRARSQGQRWGSFHKVDVARLQGKEKPAHARRAPKGWKPKDVLGIPWLVATALRGDGWYLRSDVVWNKPCGLPSTARDRPITSHEYLFLLSKSRRYTYDVEAGKTADGKKRRTVWTIAPANSGGTHLAVMPEQLVDPCVLAGCPEGGLVLDPFAGAGTVGVVAQRHGRRFLGLEQSEAYAHMAMTRIRDVAARETIRLPGVA